MNKLKPCPFCGSEAYFERCDPGCCDNIRSVLCRNMACGGELYIDTPHEEEAAMIWNTRHQDDDDDLTIAYMTGYHKRDDEVRRLREALDEVIEDIEDGEPGHAKQTAQYALSEEPKDTCPTCGSEHKSAEYPGCQAHPDPWHDEPTGRQSEDVCEWKADDVRRPADVPCDGRRAYFLPRMNYCYNCGKPIRLISNSEDENE